MKAGSALIYQMREASGLGLHACRSAALHAEERLDGDYVLALIYEDVCGLAIHVRPADPSESPADARRRHMLDRARSLRDERLRDPAWATLSSMSDALNRRS